ncbi:SPW repeat domain-containing protein [Streptomyces calvus]|uniref:SPW repeat domain-containing protein n=1 Tax=Streptomyces calvus TaxID=67282 RepID=UPI0037142B5D
MTTVHKSESARAGRLNARRSLMRAQRQQIIGLLLIVSALVLFVAPWIAGYPDTAKDAHRNELGVGVIVLMIAMARFIWYPGKWPDLAVLLAGAWMVAAPWALSLQKTAVFDGTQVIDVAVGTVLMVLAGISLLMLKLSKHHDTHR